MEKIAVLLSSYNGERFIRCQIESILAQEFIDDIELSLFVRDDGSNDSTCRIVEEMSCVDKRISIIKGTNKGLVASFFELINAVKIMNCFDYVSLSDQDDRWDKDKLQTAITSIKNIDTPFLYESTTRITDLDLNFKKIDYIPKRKVTFFNSAIQNFSAGHTYVFNKQLLRLIRDDIDCNQIYVHDAFIHNIAVVCGGIFFDKKPHNDYRQSDCNVLGASKNNSPFNWIKTRVKRIKRNDAKKYAKQIDYYLEYFNDYLDEKEKKELIRFSSCKRNFFTRLCYCFSTKFYRQRIFESFAFRVLYLFGGYKYKN